MIDLTDLNDEEILIFVYRKREVSYTDMFKEFVTKGRCSRQTFINYKRRLEDKGKLEKKISGKTRRPVYYVAEDARPMVRKLLSRYTLKRTIEKYPDELIETLFEYIEELVKIMRRYDSPYKMELRKSRIMTEAEKIEALKVYEKEGENYRMPLRALYEAWKKERAEALLIGDDHKGK